MGIDLRHIRKISQALRQRVRCCGALMLAGVAILAGCAGRHDTAGARASRSAADLYARGVRALDTGQTAAAIADLRAAVAAEPSMIMARVRLGDAYAQAGASDKAADQYEQVVRRDGYDAAIWYKLGESQRFSGNLRRAAEAYDRALRLDPQDWRSRSGLGLVRLAQGDLRQAIAEVGKALELSPAQPQTWLDYGICLDAAGDYPRGEAAYRKSLELKPRQADVLLRLGINLLAQKQSADAIGVLEQAVKFEPSTEAHRRLADALKAEKRFAEADAHYKESARLQKRRASSPSPGTPGEGRGEGPSR
jgi:Flp pilus assembly protein TadD